MNAGCRIHRLALMLLFTASMEGFLEHLRRAIVSRVRLGVYSMQLLGYRALRRLYRQRAAPYFPFEYIWYECLFFLLNSSPSRGLNLTTTLRVSSCMIQMAGVSNSPVRHLRLIYMPIRAFGYHRELRVLATELIHGYVPFFMFSILSRKSR